MKKHETERVKYYIEVIGLDEQTAAKLVDAEQKTIEIQPQFKTSKIARLIAQQNKT